MKEYRAPCVLAARRMVVIHDHDHVVETIAAPQFLVAMATGQSDVSIICAGVGIVAPTVLSPHCRERKRHRWRSEAVTSNEAAEKAETSDRGRAVAFTLDHSDAGTTERASRRYHPHDQSAFGFVIETRGHDNAGYQFRRLCQAVIRRARFSSTMETSFSSL
jgi:hypothetical protein